VLEIATAALHLPRLALDAPSPMGRVVKSQMAKANNK